MNHKRHIILLLALMTLSISAQAYYQVGNTVADFTLPDSQGNPVSLYDYKGLAVLIYFWGSC